MATQQRSFDKGAIAGARRQIQAQIREGQIHCNHKDAHGGTIDDVLTSKEFIRDRNRYSDGDVICKECKDIFNLQTYTKGEIDDSMYVLYSICNQLKLIDDMNDEDYEKVEKIMELLDELGVTVIPYYLNMVKKLAKGTKNNKNEKTRTKGRLGLNSNQFASR